MLVDKMNNIPTNLTDRNSSSLNGTGARRPSPIQFPLQTGAMVGVTGRPISLMDSSTHTPVQAHIVQVIINKDENGYGMKVSGDNPVYVQSVKEGGAAEKAGLHAGDKIIKLRAT